MTIGPIARHVMRTIRECAGDSQCLGWEAEFARAENTYQVDIASYVGADHFAIMRSSLRDRGRLLPLKAWRMFDRAEVAAMFTPTKPQPVRAGTIAGHVIYKIKGARNDDELREREGCIQASIARRVGANEFETIRAAILDRAVIGGRA